MSVCRTYRDLMPAELIAECIDRIDIATPQWLPSDWADNVDEVILGVLSMYPVDDSVQSEVEAGVQLELQSRK